MHISSMPRRNLIRQSTMPYHVTSRTNNKNWFEIPIFEVWDLCKESLIYALKQKPVIIHSFMLMGNHYHLLLTTPNSNIDGFMMLYNRKLSNLINKKSGVTNHKFSNRYKWTIVDNQSYLLNVYRYIYQNPVRAKLTIDCFSYPYSSLHFSRYESKLFNHRPHIYYGREKSWLEKNMGEEFDEMIKTSLKKETFRPAKVPAYFRKILNNPQV